MFLSATIHRVLYAILVRFNRLFYFLPDRTYIKLEYWIKTGNLLRLDNPKSFNEKIQWMKLFCRTDIMTIMADKYLVKEYVSKTIGKEYVIPTLTTWDSPDEIDFDSLPDKFVLKTNHDSGGVYICKDRNNLNPRKAIKKLSRSFNRNYYKLHREWPYKNIKRKILAEPYLEDESGELQDYKLMIFNGKFKCAFVCTERFSKSGLRITIFDENWNVMPFERLKHPRSSKSIPPPRSFKKMIQFAERISKGFDFMRVDFYEINEKPVFGEITFYPASGYDFFTPRIYDQILGDWVDLTNFKKA